MGSAARLSLSAADRARLTGVAHTLASPLTYPSVDAWRRAVTRETKELLGADKASFLLPAEDVDDADDTGGVRTAGASLFSEDVPWEDRSAYPTVIQPLDATWSVWQRQVTLGAWDRETLWRPLRELYLRSAYYNEYIVPGRYFDAVGLTRDLGGPERLTGPSTVAGLWLHHDRPTGRVFGDRGRAILELLLPAFIAGAEALHRLGAHRAALAGSLDALGLALLVIDEAGRVVHRTPALTQLLANDPDGTRLLGEMAQAAGALARLGMEPRRSPVPGQRSGDGSGHPGAVARDVHTRLGRYRLRATTVSPELFARAPVVLVTAERAGPEPLDTESLRDRCGLTPAQIRVARLLAERRRIAEVAATLGISIHTARRHTEAVRQKLGVRSVNDIAGVVLGHREPAIVALGSRATVGRKLRGE